MSEAAAGGISAAAALVIDGYADRGTGGRNGRLVALLELAGGGVYLLVHGLLLVA